MAKIAGKSKIIIAADDFGISDESNQKILELLALGKIDRVAVMIDGLRLPDKEEVSKLLESGVALDIHLNSFQKITAGRKLTEKTFPRLMDFSRRLFLGDIGTRKMEEGWREEISTFRKIFGRKPNGIGAHQHIHFFPSYFKIVAKLAKEFGIPYVRFGKRGLIGKPRSGVFRIIRALHPADRKHFHRSGLESSDYWFSLDWTKDIAKYLQNIPEGTVEMVCHPERPEEYRIIKENF